LDISLWRGAMLTPHNHVFQEARAGIEPANSGFAGRRPVAHGIRAWLSVRA